MKKTKSKSAKKSKRELVIQKIKEDENRKKQIEYEFRKREIKENTDRLERIAQLKEAKKKETEILKEKLIRQTQKEKILLDYINEIKERLFKTFKKKDKKYLNMHFSNLDLISKIQEEFQYELNQNKLEMEAIAAERFHEEEERQKKEINKIVREQSDIFDHVEEIKKSLTKINPLLRSTSDKAGLLEDNLSNLKIRFQIEKITKENLSSILQRQNFIAEKNIKEYNQLKGADINLHYLKHLDLDNNDIFTPCNYSELTDNNNDNILTSVKSPSSPRTENKIAMTELMNNSEFKKMYLFLNKKMMEKKAELLKEEHNTALARRNLMNMKAILEKCFEDISYESKKILLKSPSAININSPLHFATSPNNKRFSFDIKKNKNERNMYILSYILDNCLATQKTLKEKPKMLIRTRSSTALGRRK